MGWRDADVGERELLPCCRHSRLSIVTGEQSRANTDRLSKASETIVREALSLEHCNAATDFRTINVAFYAHRPKEDNIKLEWSLKCNPYIMGIPIGGTMAGYLCVMRWKSA